MQTILTVQLQTVADNFDSAVADSCRQFRQAADFIATFTVTVNNNLDRLQNLLQPLTVNSDFLDLPQKRSGGSKPNIKCLHLGIIQKVCNKLIC